MCTYVHEENVMKNVNTLETFTKKKLAVACTTATQDRETAKKSGKVFADLMHAEGFRSNHFSKELTSATSIVTGETERAPNPNYTFVYDRALLALPAQDQQLAAMDNPDGLSKADKEIRTLARKVGTDAVSNLIAQLRKREVQEERERETTAAIKAIPDEAMNEAIAKDAVLEADKKEPRYVAALKKAAADQFQSDKAQAKLNPSLAERLAGLVSTLDKHEVWQTESKYVSKWIKKIEEEIEAAKQ